MVKLIGVVNEMMVVYDVFVIMSVYIVYMCLNGVM